MRSTKGKVRKTSVNGRRVLNDLQSSTPTECKSGFESASAFQAVFETAESLKLSTTQIMLLRNIEILPSQYIKDREIFPQAAKRTTLLRELVLLVAALRDRDISPRLPATNISTDLLQKLVIQLRRHVTQLKSK